MEMDPLQFTSWTVGDSSDRGRSYAAINDLDVFLYFYR